MCYGVFSFSFYISVAGTPVCHSLHMCVKVREQVGVVLSIHPSCGAKLVISVGGEHLYPLSLPVGLWGFLYRVSCSLGWSQTLLSPASASRILGRGQHLCYFCPLF